MAMIMMKRMNERGIAATIAMITALKEVSNPLERRAEAQAILSDPRNFETLDIEGAEIDPDARFSTALDFVRHVLPALKKTGAAYLRDRGLNAFIVLIYVDQIIGLKARDPIDYVVKDKGSKDGGRMRNYRNAVFVFLSLYDLHGDNADVCRCLLNVPLNQLGNTMERLAQQNKVMSSTACLELVLSMFYHRSTGKPRRAPRSKSVRYKTKSISHALQELSLIVFKQCALNYDISRMTAEQMFRLVPSTHGLAPWKKHAEEWFAAERAKEAVAA
jgi:hypothetical protein